MSAATSTTTAPAGGRLTYALGGKTRLEILYALAVSDEPLRQYELADELGISEPAISRSKQHLVDAGIVVETDDGLTVSDEFADAYTALFEVLTEP